MSKVFLTQNTGGVDGKLLGTDPIFRAPTARIDNIFKCERDEVPINTAAWGGSIIYRPIRSFDLLGPCHLIGTHAAQAASGAGANYPRFCDYVGFHALRLLKLEFSSNPLQSFTGLDLYRAHSCRTRSEDTYTSAVDGGLQSDPATRYANAQSTTHEIITPLFLLFWADAPKNWLPYSITALRDDLIMTVTYALQNEVVETDAGTISGAISSLVLRCEGVYVSLREAALIYQETTSPNAEFGTKGWTRLVKTQDRMDNQAITAGTSSQDLRLSSLFKPYSDIMFTIRSNSDIPSGASTASSINHNDFKKVTQFSLLGNNETMKINVTDKFHRHITQNGFQQGSCDEYLYRHSFGFAPDANDQLGFMSYEGMGNPILRFTTESSITGRADITGNTHNLAVLYNGQLSMLFKA